MLCPNHKAIIGAAKDDIKKALEGMLEPEREAAIPRTHAGPRPFGGVAGTRRGVKCLHAHYAWFLAGGDDPVGRWVDERIGPEAPASAAEPDDDERRR